MGRAEALYDSTGLRRLTSAAEQALRKAGQTGSRFGPDVIAELELLAASVALAPDRHEASKDFVSFAIPIFAKSPVEQEVLTRELLGQEREVLVSRIFDPGPSSKREAAQTDEPTDETKLFNQPPAGNAKTDADKATRAPSEPPKSIARTIASATAALLQRVVDWLQRLDLFKSREAKRARLIRKNVSQLAEEFSLSLGTVPASTAVLDLRQSAMRAANRSAKVTKRLDVGRTLDRTLRNGGLFVPAYRTKQVATEYLVLVRQLSNVDLEFARIKALLDELKKHGVGLFYYPYRGDPRHVIDTLSGKRNSMVELRALQERHPNARLIVVSEGRELVNSFTLEPLGWTSGLQQWPRRALITPLPSSSWGTVESNVHFGLGFSIASSREHAFDRLDRVLGGSGPIAWAPDDATREIIPLFVASPTAQYITALEPPEDEQQALLLDLRLHLGAEGFRWLGVCAFFPAMSPELALHYGRQLFDETADDFEETFARLSGLPWMRFGHMPYWVRKLVIGDLTEPQQVQARKIIAETVSQANLSREPAQSSWQRMSIATGDAKLTLPIRIEGAGPLGGLEVDTLSIEFLASGFDQDIDPILNLDEQRIGQLVAHVEQDAPDAITLGEQTFDRVEQNSASPTDVFSRSRAIIATSHLGGRLGKTIIEALQSRGHNVIELMASGMREDIEAAAADHRQQIALADVIIAAPLGNQSGEQRERFMRYDVSDAGERGIRIRLSPEALPEEGKIDFSHWGGDTGDDCWRELIRRIDDIYDSVRLTPKVFLLGDAREENLSRQIVQYLDAKGMKVWADPASLDKRKDGGVKTRLGIDMADALVVVWTKALLNNSRIVEEARYASEQHKIVSVVPNGVSRRQLPEGIQKGRLHIETGRQEIELDRIVDHVRQIRASASRLSEAPLNEVPGSTGKSSKGRIFISGNLHAGDFKGQFISVLESAGYITVRKDDLSSERVPERSLPELLDAVEVIAVLWGEGSASSNFVYTEAQHGLKLKKLLQVYMPDFPPDKIPTPFNAYQALPLSASYQIVEAADRIVRGEGQGSHDEKMDIFLSYSRMEAAEAIALTEWLKSEGFTVFRDTEQERGLVAGVQWEDALRERIEACRTMICWGTSTWLASKWGQREAKIAHELQKRIIVVGVGGPGPQLPLDLSNWSKLEAVILERAVARPRASDTNASNSQSFEKLFSAESVSLLRKLIKKVDEGEGDGSTHHVRPTQTFHGHTDFVGSAAFSSDGSRVLTASRDSTARIWSTSSGRELGRLIGHDGEVRTAEFRPIDDLVATAGDDGTIRTWKADTFGEIVRAKVHGTVVARLKFSPDGRTIATASWDGTSVILDSDTLEKLAVLQGHSDKVWWSTYSPDGREIATASDDRTVRVWDVSSGAEVALLDGYDEGVLSVAFSSDGRFLASSSRDGKTRIWNAKNYQLESILEGHSAWVGSVAFSSSSKLLVTASDDRSVKIWNVPSWRLVETIDGHTEIVNYASFSSDSRQLVTASHDRTARTWALVREPIA